MEKKIMDLKVESQLKLSRFQLRPYQLPLLTAYENKKYRRILSIMPRRAGKDMTAWYLAIRACIRKPIVCFYIFPTYAQGKKILWDSLMNDGTRILNLSLMKL